jgi:hypothetical protein
VTREELGPSRVAGDVVITPVVRTRVEERRVGGALLVVARKWPVAVWIRSRGREWRVELPAAGAGDAGPGDAPPPPHSGAPGRSNQERAPWVHAGPLPQWRRVRLLACSGSKRAQASA